MTRKAHRLRIVVSYTEPRLLADVIAVFPDGRFGYGKELESATVSGTFIGKWVIYYIHKYKRFG